jgi:ribosomal protein S24E
MVVTIKEKNEQKMLGRTLVKAHTSFDAATPTKMNIRKQLAKELKVKEEQVIVRHIHTGFGKRSAEVAAVVYDKAETASALEHKKLVEKHSIKEEPKKEEKADSEEKAVDAPKEEAPGEEKKEE